MRGLALGHPPHPPGALPFVKGGAQLGSVGAFRDNPHPDLVLVDDVWVLQADWERAGGRQGVAPVRS